MSLACYFALIRAFIFYAQLLQFNLQNSSAAVVRLATHRQDRFGIFILSLLELNFASGEKLSKSFVISVSNMAQ